MKPSVVIVSPAMADANNGNWQTARRWASMLQQRYAVRIVRQWPDGPWAAGDAVMLALHARRSAASIAAWAEARGAGPKGLAVVLTGTDLYRDIHTDAAALRSLMLASRLVVLQERAPDALPAGVRAKAVVIFQSCSTRQPVGKTLRHVRAVMVGHLRAEKSPQTLFAAARLLSPDEGIMLDHIGEALDPAWAEQARRTAEACPHYRWLGAQPHEATRRRIQQAHVLVHPSRMEGGAHVVMEAVRAGTPVLASRVAGNIGMLGQAYDGYFDDDDPVGLVRLLRRCRLDQTGGADPAGVTGRLHAQCQARAGLFSPEAERSALIQLVNELTH